MSTSPEQVVPTDEIGPRAIGMALLSAVIVAPVATGILGVTGMPAVGLSGVVTGLAAGLLVGAAGTSRRLPTIAALATLYGMAVALPVADYLSALLGRYASSLLRLLGSGDDPTDRTAGFPYWIVGALLAFGICAVRVSRARACISGTPGRLLDSLRSWLPEHPRVLTVRGITALVGAVLIGVALTRGQLLAADRLGVTFWGDYGYGGDAYFYVDLTHATWFRAASALIASVIVFRVFRAASWIGVPLCAWLGACLAGVLLPHNVEVSAMPEVVVAGIIGGGIGAAAAVAAVRHRGARLGLVVYTGWISLLEFSVTRYPSIEPNAPVSWLAWLSSKYGYEVQAGMPQAALLVSAVLAAWSAVRLGRVGAGVVAGTAGPLLLAIVYVSVGSRAYDHMTQASPYDSAVQAVPLAVVVSWLAAMLSVDARMRIRRRRRINTSRPRQAH